MILRMFLLVNFALMLIWPQMVSAALCGNKQNITYVKLPHDKDWMSIQDFETFIVNKTMGEMYYALPRPPPYTPSIHYFSTVIRVEGLPGYLHQSIGEDVGETSRCSRYNVSFSPGPISGRALFYGRRRESKETAQYKMSLNVNVRGIENQSAAGTGVFTASTTADGFWSNCPSQYVWQMRCANYYPGKKYCDTNDVTLGVFLHGNMDDAPVIDIVEDLCEKIGVKLGAADFKWFFIFGENTLC